MSTYFKQSLREGEEPLLILRQHGATWLWPALRTVILLIIPLPFVSYVFTYWWLGLIVIGWWLVVAIWGLLSWFTWYFNITLVTSQRVLDIEQASIFSRKVREVTHDKISEVTFEIKGPVTTIFGYGNVSVYFDGGDKPIIIEAVAEPEVLKDQLLKVQEYVKQEQAETTNLDVEQIARIVREVKDTKEVPVHIKNNSKKEDA